MRVYSHDDAAGLLAARKTNSSKRDFGYVALVGGCLKYSGAIRLSAMAAHETGDGLAQISAVQSASMQSVPVQLASTQSVSGRSASMQTDAEQAAVLAEAAQVSGAGVVTVAAPKEICPLIVPQILCETLMPLNEAGLAEVSRGSFVPLSEAFAKYDVICFGMGIGREPEVPVMLKELLENFRGILVIDADGLWALTQLDPNVLKTSRARLVLTPHYGEYKMLTAWNSALPVSGDLILLLKGPNPEGKETLITDGSAEILVDTGTSGMSKGGSGDVLSGIIGAMAGQYGKENLTEAVAFAAYVNGLAGMKAASDYGVVSMTPKDTAAAIRSAINSILG